MSFGQHILFRHDTGLEMRPAIVPHFSCGSSEKVYIDQLKKRKVLTDESR